MKKVFYILPVFLLTACEADDVISLEQKEETQEKNVIITSDVEDYAVVYDNAPEEFVVKDTRATMDGKGFNNRDLIRLKIVCPFSPNTERGETTDGNSSDSFYLLYRQESQWQRVMNKSNDAANGFDFDISGSYSYSNSPAISSYFEAQQTPYVYTAISWTEEKLFVARTGGSVAKPTTSVIDQYCNVFHADQRKEKDYLASDLLWAQTYMQTGAWNIHLGFQHKMACLEIEVQPETAVSDTAVLTLHGMPDIDQAEVVVGDYYADASKSNSNYGYRQKASCSYENHGKVIGVAVNVEADARAKTYAMTGNPSPAGGFYSASAWGSISNTGVYTAHPLGGNKFCLIVPPCNLDPENTADESRKAIFWLQDGENRYQVKMDRTLFEEGKRYKMILKVN